MNKLNRVFASCLIAALGITGVSIFAQYNLVLAVVFELAPLVYYFTRLERLARVESLSQTAIDSIYYFGFVITIFALAASVFRVYFFGFGADLTGIVGHFAVGLLATGLALVFRMLLIARSEAFNAKDLGESIESYIQRVDNVVVSVEASAAHFEGLAQSLEERTERVVSAAHDSFSNSLNQSAQLFQAETKRVMTDCAEAIQSFHDVVEKISDSGKVAEFEQNLGQIVLGLKTFAGEMGTYGRRVTQEAVNSSTAALGSTSKAFGEHLQALYSKNNDLMNQGLSQIKELDFSEEVAEIKADLTGLSRSITTFGKKFNDLEAKLTQAVAVESSHAATGVLEKFSVELIDVVQGLRASLATGSDEIAKSMSATANARVEAFGKAVSSKVNKQLGQVATDVSSVSAALRDLKVNVESARASHGKDEFFETIKATRDLLDEFNRSLSSSIEVMSALRAGKSMIEDDTYLAVSVAPPRSAVGNG